MSMGLRSRADGSRCPGGSISEIVFAYKEFPLRMSMGVRNRVQGHRGPGGNVFQLI